MERDTNIQRTAHYIGVLARHPYNEGLNITYEREQIIRFIKYHKWAKAKLPSKNSTDLVSTTKYLWLLGKIIVWAWHEDFNKAQMNKWVKQEFIDDLLNHSWFWLQD